MKLSSAGLALLLLTLSIHASAYELSGPTWFSGQTTFFVDIPGEAPSGDSWNAAFSHALNAWTAETSFTYFIESEYRDPCAGQNTSDLGDRITGVDFATTRCGIAFGENVLAITLESFICSDDDCTGSKEYIETDIIFNEAVNWDIYSGSRQSDVEDFERVALHELGHALGLNHEFTAEAIMAPFISDLNSLQQDDINGANFLYGDFTAASSIYGIAIQQANDGVFTDVSSSKQYQGELNSNDAQFEGKFLDIHQITFTEDSEVNITLASDAFDAALLLVRIDSTQQFFADQLFTDNNSGPNTNAHIEEILSAGTYWVGATSNSGGEQGTYTLDVSSIPQGSSNSPESFTSVYGIDVEINPNPVIFDRLSVGDNQFDSRFIDIYQLQVSEAIELKIDVASEQFDTRMYLAQILDDQQFGSLLIEDDDGGIGSNSRIQAEMTPGTYWIAVTSFSPGTIGAYEVTINVVID